MRASEWQFLCAVHEQPKSCCAIDYCCHTLDWAANVVTDQKIFPSRFVALSDTHNKNIAMKNLVNVFRRLHRIFAHAWFQHRSVFWSVERETGLYVFFKTVCDMYDLLPGETYKLPPEAEGLDPEKASQLSAVSDKQAQATPVSGLPTGGVFPGGQAFLKAEDAPRAEDDHGVGRTNTRRHIRSSPSTGSAVTTVIEADEDEGAELAARARALHIASAASAEPVLEEEAEPEAEEVPVIVEDSVMQESGESVDSSSVEAETPTVATAESTVAPVKSDEDKEEAAPLGDIEPEAPSEEETSAPAASQEQRQSTEVDEEAPSAVTDGKETSESKEIPSTDTAEDGEPSADATTLVEEAPSEPVEEKSIPAPSEPDAPASTEEPSAAGELKDTIEKPTEEKENTPDDIDTNPTEEKKE